MTRILNISVVIPTFNRPLSLANTIKSFLFYTDIPKEIIVIDQSEKQDVRRTNKEFCEQFHNVKYVYCKIPSTTKSRNMGLMLATTDIIVFSDDDIELFEDTLINLYSFMNNKNVSLVGGIDSLSSTKSSPFSYLACTKSFSKKNVGHVTSSYLGRYPNKISEKTRTEWAMGYFFAIRKSLCVKWNIMFDENMKGYAFNEDLDFTYRYFLKCKENDLECYISSKVLVKHLCSKEYRIHNYSHLLRIICNRYYIMHKFPVKIVNTLSFYISLFFLKIKLARNKDSLIAFKRAKKQFLLYKKEIAKGILDNVYD